MHQPRDQTQLDKSNNLNDKPDYSDNAKCWTSVLLQSPIEERTLVETISCSVDRQFLIEDQPYSYNQRLELDKYLEVTVDYYPSRVRLKSNTCTYITGLVQLKSMCPSFPRLEQENGVDLVCLIDSSMDLDQKIANQITSCLSVLIRTLTKKDRLCLISFGAQASQRSAFKQCDDSNKKLFEKLIRELSHSGPARLLPSISLACQIIEQRTHQRPLSSIFLFSARQGEKAEQAEILQLLENAAATFSVHTFGYGVNIDTEFLIQISQMKNGTFYSIQHQDAPKNFVVNALGELFSVVAVKLHVEIRCSQQLGLKFLEQSTTKWKKSKESVCSLELTQYSAGKTQSFLFGVEFPSNLDEGNWMSQQVSPASVWITYQLIELPIISTLAVSKNILVQGYRCLEPLDGERMPQAFHYFVQKQLILDTIKIAQQCAEKGDAQEIITSCIKSFKSDTQSSSSTTFLRLLELCSNYAQPQNITDGVRPIGLAQVYHVIETENMIDELTQTCGSIMQTQNSIQQSMVQEFMVGDFLLSSDAFP